MAEKGFEVRLVDSSTETISNADGYAEDGSYLHLYSGYRTTGKRKVASFPTVQVVWIKRIQKDTE